MKTFTIYTKPGSFYWNKTRVMYVVILFAFVLLLVLENVFKLSRPHVAYDLWLYLFIGITFYGSGTAILGVGKYQTLYGELEGSISFQPESVTIREQTIDLDKIDKIEFDVNDYTGLFLHKSFLRYFENRLSMGVDNKLILHLNGGSTISTQFQLLEAGDFKEIQDTLEGYYAKGKIGYLQTVDLLGLSTREEWDRLKKMKAGYKEV